MSAFSSLPSHSSSNDEELLALLNRFAIQVSKHPHSYVRAKEFVECLEAVWQNAPLQLAREFRKLIDKVPHRSGSYSAVVQGMNRLWNSQKIPRPTI